jgi:hypothetical protein
MHTRLLILSVSAGLMTLALQAPVGQGQAACTISDTQVIHSYNVAIAAGASTSQGSVFNAAIDLEYSANNTPCDLVGSDGDDEAGIGGAKMPLIGATCPYSQDDRNVAAGGAPVTVGHHGLGGIDVTNLGGIDVTWSSGIDGADPVQGSACVGNGVISNDITTDPNDCLDTQGERLGLAGNVVKPTSPSGTNDPNSPYTCFDAVDGNVRTFLHFGPFVGTNPGSGTLVVIDLTGNPVTVDPGWTPETPNSIVGFSLPISGTITSGDGSSC